MPSAGSFPSRSPGELRVFSLDFTNDLAVGEHIVSATTTLSAIPPIQDGNAATLLASGTAIGLNGASVAAIVAQEIGTNTNNTTGFLPNVSYLWTIKAITSDAEILIWNATIPIAAT